MLDWNNAREFPTGTLVVGLSYGHVEFAVVPDNDGWRVQIHLDTKLIYVDDDVKSPDRDAGKLRAEALYKKAAAAWCCLDMLQELVPDEKWAELNKRRDSG